MYNYTLVVLLTFSIVKGHVTFFKHLLFVRSPNVD